MTVLVINSGSTSVKIAAIDNQRRLFDLTIERLGGSAPGLVVWSDGREPDRCEPQHAAALTSVFPEIVDRLADQNIMAVGHRVVHGGEEFHAETVINDEVEQRIDALSTLAPLHNPVNLAGIRAARQQWPDLPHVAVFDTAFHHTLPTRAKLYAIDQRLAQRHSIRRFGFHGTSHQYVAKRAAEFFGEDLRDLRVITCHLGGGCSACAIEYGRSVETSMGMTPLEGLVMATRTGDIDPGAIVQLLKSEQMNAQELDTLLNRKSGLFGLSGVGGDMRDIESGAAEGDDSCQQALQVFCHRVRKYIGSYAAVMGGVDLIVFTGGIGENSATVRHRVAQRLDFLGARLDEAINREIVLSHSDPVALFSQTHSRVRLAAVKTDEMQAIADQTRRAVGATVLSARKPIPVAISARHVHLTQASVEKLFGPEYQLTEYKPLSQPGQFAAQEQVTLIGPKRSIQGVRVLGPTRSKDQVEISRTDEFYLGIDAPVRASGQTDNTPGITLEGTDRRRLDLSNGVICALRHIHMTPADAQEFGVEQGDLVEVEVGQGSSRSLTFGDTLIRVRSSYKLEMHIDTDEGNAAELNSQDSGELQPTEGVAVLK